MTLEKLWEKYISKTLQNNEKQFQGTLTASDVAWEKRFHKKVTEKMNELGMGFEEQIKWQQERS